MAQWQRRMLATFVALILLVTLSVPALAVTEPQPPTVQEPVHSVVNGIDLSTVKVNLTEEQAIQKALATFPIPNDLGKPTVHLWSDSGKFSQGPTWNLTWEKDPRLGGTRLTYSVGINAESGEFVSYSAYSYDPYGLPPVINYTRDEAQQLADEWFTKLVPADKKAQPQPTLEYGGTDLSYTWIRVENGVPFPDNQITIAINPSDGTLSSFYRNWDEKIVFPAVDAVISVDDARKAYDQLAGAELIYQRFYTPAGRSEVKLVYRSKAQNASVDAVTGQMVDYNGRPWTGDGNPIDLSTSDVKLVALEKQLTREEALALARQYLGEDAKVEPSYSSYNAPGETTGKYVDEGLHVSTWTFSWDIQGKEANQYRYLSATVDVDHGVLMNFNCYDGYVTDEELRDKTPVSEEVARTTAIEFLKQTRPDLLNHLSFTDRSVVETYPGWPEDRPKPIQREYYFNFQRIVDVNGRRIRFDADNVSVSVDCFTGKVRSFYVNWSEPEFPGLDDGILTPEQAMEAFHRETPLQLTYTRSYIPYSEGEIKVQLVYRPYNLYNGNLIDPFTGHLLDYSGRDVTELKRGAEDIADHAARREIELMINRGVFEVKDGKFGPEVVMTRGDLAKALVLAFNQGYLVTEFKRMAAMGMGGGAAPAPSYADVYYDNGYYGYVEAAVRAGILVPKIAGEKLNPDELVTHEELALLTARAMGYSSVINMKTSISNGFTDADKIGTDYRNAVGLLAGLEILSNEGEFKPQDQVTRAYAAQVLAQAVQKSQRRYYY